MVSPHPSGTVTFLFTDIEGSTTIAEHHPDAWEELRDHHDRLLHETMQAHEGHVFQIVGDQFCVAFHTAEDAVSAAIEAQQALARHKWTPAPIKIRIGIHTGTARSTGIDDPSGGYRGYAALACVERIMSAAHGGQILLSNTTAEMVRNGLPAEVYLVDMQEHRLKGLLNPQHLWQVKAEGLQSKFSPLESLNSIPNNLPAQLTDFIGRQQAIAGVIAQLEGSRMVSLTGPGGTGKTRLSLQVGAEVMADFPDGVWLVELAPVSDTHLVPQALISAFGVQEQGGHSIREVLIDYVKSRRMLIILDNCEHLVQTCAELAAEMLRAGPRVKILATSREALHIPGEQVYPVPTMSFPAAEQVSSVEELGRYEAVRLFVDRAVAAQPGFKVEQQHIPALTTICQQLDGIPLAIELAAARSRALSIEALAERLEDRFRLLNRGDRTAVPRQQTLRALLDWSYDLLSEPERRLLERLSVFMGGWTLESAEGVTSGELIEKLDVLDLISSLVDKSLLSMKADGSRYEMLSTVRQYAFEKLTDAGQEPVYRQKHAEHFAALAQEAEPQLTQGDQVRWLTRLEADHENLRAALGWFLQSEDNEAALTLAGTLGRFWYVHSHYTEGREWLRRALADAPAKPSPGLAKAYQWAGTLARLQADFDHAEEYANRCVSACHETGDALVEANALLDLGYVSYGRSDFAQARKDFERSLAAFNELGDQHGSADSQKALGIVATLHEDYKEAQTLLQNALRLYQVEDDKWGMASTMLNIGVVARHRHDKGEARRAYEQSLALSRELQDKRGMAIALLDLGYEIFNEGDDTGARSRYEESRTLLREIGENQTLSVALLNSALVAYAQGDLAEARALYEESLNLLSQMGNKWGLAYALSGLASVHGAEGQEVAAAQLQGAVVSMLDALKARLDTPEQSAFDQTQAELKRSMGEDAYQRAFQGGRDLSQSEAVDLAIGDG